jgi:hypothetical protein
MQMPRFRIRTLMIAIAVAAVLTAGGVEARRLRNYLKTAAQPGVYALCGTTTMHRQVG